MLHGLFSKNTILRWLANVTLCVASILVTIAVVEASLRHSHYGKQFRQFESDGFFPRYYHVPDSINGYDIAPNFPPTNLIHHDYIDIFGNPYTISSNDLGCRDRRLAREDSYALLLGDSFTWANVPLEQAFGTLVEQLIGMRVLNCGVSGYGTRHEHYKLKKVLNQAGAPKLIIVGYFIGNDLIDDYVYPEYTVLDGYLTTKTAIAKRTDRKAERVTYTDQELMDKIKQRHPKPSASLLSQSKDFLTKHLVIYNVLKNSTQVRELVSHLGLAEPPKHPISNINAPRMSESRYIFHSLDQYPWLGDAWKTHLDSLRQFKQSAEDINAKLLVVMIPTREQVYDYLRPSVGMEDWELPNRRLTEFFEKQGINVLDLLPEFRRYANPKPKLELDSVEDLYWSHDFHWNIKGNQLAGLLISHYLLEHRFGELRDKDKRLSDIKQRLAIDFRGREVLVRSCSPSSEDDHTCGNGKQGSKIASE